MSILRDFGREKDRYDLVFVGSSLVYRSIDPRIIDEELARAGFRVRSYNLGLPGMRPHEANALLRQVLATKPARLRWAVVEVADAVAFFAGAQSNYVTGQVLSVSGGLTMVG